MTALLACVLGGAAIAPAGSQARGIVVAKKRADGTLSAPVDGEDYLFGIYHALLISVERYQRPFAALRTPHEDTSRLKRVLRDQYGFAQIAELQDEQATRAGILQAIGAYRDILDDDDNLLIYFAGHGIKQGHGDNEEDSDYYWVPYDGSREFTSWVAAVELRSVIRNIRARHTVLISDSCFAGGLLRGNGGLMTRSAPKSVRSQHRKASCQVFTSGGLEPVEDSGRDGCSLFAYHLSQRLERHQDSYLTLRGLAHAVTGDVSGALESRQVPELGPIRGGRHEYGDFVFFRTTVPGERVARPVAVLQAGVPAGWVLPPGVVRTDDGRIVSRVAGRDASEMILVAGGRFRPQGSKDLVVIEPFLIDKFEVTNALFKAFLRASPQVLKDSTAFNRAGFDAPQQPAVSIDLVVARKFAAWAGKALPDEHQWEFAASYDLAQGRARRYPWGDAFAHGGFTATTHPPPVDAFPNDVAAAGVRGMGGGVRELCELVHRDPERGVIRGGTQYLMIRLDRLDQDVTYRAPCAAVDRFANVGFRCVLRLRRP